MALPLHVKQLVDSNIRQRIVTYDFMEPNKKYLKQTWYCEDELEFLHGMLVGEILGDSYRTAAMYLERVPTEEENEEIHSMVKMQNSEIKEMINRAKNV